MPDDRLIVRGAREHNLRNIDVEIPRGSLTVLRPELGAILAGERFLAEIMTTAP